MHEQQEMNIYVGLTLWQCVCIVAKCQHERSEERILKMETVLVMLHLGYEQASVCQPRVEYSVAYGALSLPVQWEFQ